jgi:hypothetical protein
MRIFIPQPPRHFFVSAISAYSSPRARGAIAGRMKTAALVLCLLVSPLVAVAQPRKVDVPHSDQEIGSWLLTCAMDPMTDTRVCRMRHRLWLTVPSDSAPGMAFEVKPRFDLLVPAVTVRHLSLGTALNGLLTLTATAQLRFDGNPMIELPCTLEGVSIVCVPGKADASILAEQLPQARSVMVRFRAVGNLPLPVPDGPLALDLDRTAEALDHYRLAGPASDGAEPRLGRDLKGAVERLLRGIGVPGMEPQAQGG